jgi:hypothetical protein
VPGYLLQQACPSPANYSSRYNAGMLSRRFIRYSTILVALLVMAGISLSAQEKTRRGRKYKPPPPTSKVEITVVRASDSKPIENAAVIFHVDIDGDKGNMELKTNEDGKSVIDVLPIGSVMRLQIIAKGFQTYGQDYKIDKPEMAFDVKMRRPTDQYSIYKDHDGKDGNAPAEPDEDKDADKQSDEPKDKPAPGPPTAEPKPQSR